MIGAMRVVAGVGLAAPQVGVLPRVAVIEMLEDEVIVLINPEIVKKQGERLVQEGCLSILGCQEDINRSVWVKVKVEDRQGWDVRIKG